MAAKGRDAVPVEEYLQAAGVNVTVVTDADYRSLLLPCDALEEGEGPARSAGPLGFGPEISRGAGR